MYDHYSVSRANSDQEQELDTSDDESHFWSA